MRLISKNFSLLLLYMTEGRHRSWVIVINNYTQTDWFAIKYVFAKAIYGICGEEIGEAGTPHLQAYATFLTAITLTALKKSLPRAHLLVANGTDEENKKYCSKDNTNIYEVGTPRVGQGQRTDIKDISQKIKNREITIEDCMFDYPEMYLRYSRSLEKMFNAVMVPRTQPPQVIWLYGKAGTGKSRFCIEKHPSHYIKDGTPWWDNYTQQEAIIIDDFDNNIPYRTLLRILDRYAYQGQVKGSYVQIASPYIYITCEFKPSHFWEANELAQIVRRLTSVVEIK